MHSQWTPAPSLSGSLALAVALLASCGASTPPGADETQIKQFTGKGYFADDQYSIATSFSSWQSANTEYEIALTVPSQSGPYPLLIYLPALGENRMAGETWRTTWARAGYAVLCLQPLAEDARAWSASSLSWRAGQDDFASQARERYSGRVMSDRLQALNAILQELARHQSTSETPFDRIDLEKTALAGFDLGAYTAMFVAGEHPSNLVMTKFPVTIRAVIALNPYARFTDPDLENRYRSMAMPVLSITSDSEAVATDSVANPGQYQAPYAHMPAGDKYLAVLAGIPHGAFSGGTSPGFDVLPTPTAQAMAVAAIQSISTAFLDSAVKRNATAREWLRKDANRWLRDTGELKRK
ncbi:MAG: hypothetical protein HY066_06815 [Betaproteobacteria bacterium]|nr:hypothetical protein [Betaproteobacteria bacterium]